MKIRNIINEALTAAEEEELKKLGQVLKNDPTLQKDTAFSGLFSKFDTWMSGKSQPTANATTPLGAAWPTANATTPLGAATKANAYLKKEQIEKIQGSLRKAGVTAVGNPGVNDELFAKAVFDFQKIAKLPLTGKYDMPTYRALQDAAWGKGSSPTDAGKTEPAVVVTTPEEFDKLPGKVLKKSGDISEYKILDTKPYTNDPSVTAVLFAQKYDGDVRFFISGLDPVDRREFTPGEEVISNHDKNLAKMKAIFASPLKLKGPYLFYPNTVAMMLANEIRQAAAPVNPKTTNITPLGPDNNPENKTLPPFPVSPNTKPSPSLGNETPFGDRQGR